MKPSRRSVLWLIVVASLALTGCAGSGWLNPQGPAEPAHNYPERGPTLESTGTRQWQLQTLKELHGITMKYEEEKARRITAEGEVERRNTESSRLKTRAEQAAKAQVASEKRIAELETQLGAAQAELEKALHKLQLAEKGLIKAQARLKEEKRRADQLDDKLFTEVKEHVKTKTKLTQIQIEMLKLERAKADAKGPDAK